MFQSIGGCHCIFRTLVYSDEMVPPLRLPHRASVASLNAPRTSLTSSRGNAIASQTCIRPTSRPACSSGICSCSSRSIPLPPSRPQLAPMSTMQSTHGHSQACCNIPPVLSEGYVPKGSYEELGGMKSCECQRHSSSFAMTRANKELCRCDRPTRSYERNCCCFRHFRLL